MKRNGKVVWVQPCYGRNPKTGQDVGQRHRWHPNKWGEGRCAFCGKYLEDLLEVAAYEGQRQ